MFWFYTPFFSIEKKDERGKSMKCLVEKTVILLSIHVFLLWKDRKIGKSKTIWKSCLSSLFSSLRNEGSKKEKIRTVKFFFLSFFISASNFIY